MFHKAVDPLRPAQFSEFIGQANLKNDIEILIKAAKKREQMPEHILVSGPPGTGKTTIAHIVANHLDVNLHAVNAPNVEKPGDIAALLTSMDRPSIIFIDEIHRLDTKSEELLYSALEDGKIDVLLGDGYTAKSLTLPLQPFTLIAATTQPGLLSAPLRDRFGLLLRFDLYSETELSYIVQRSAELLSIKIENEAALEIARRGRGTPRIANRWLRRVRDFAEVKEDKNLENDYITKKTVVNALESHGIDSLGLDYTARDILQKIIKDFKGGPVGLESLAAATGEARTSIELVYEPFLIQSGLLQRTSRGRVATPKAYKHLESVDKNKPRN